MSSLRERVAAAICAERGNGEDVGNYDVGLADAALEPVRAEWRKRSEALAARLDQAQDLIRSGCPEMANAVLQRAGDQLVDDLDVLCTVDD